MIPAFLSKVICLDIEQQNYSIVLISFWDSSLILIQIKFEKRKISHNKLKSFVDRNANLLNSTALAIGEKIDPQMYPAADLPPKFEDRYSSGNWV